MHHTKRLDLIHAQLECADMSIQAALGNFTVIAGGSYIGSLQEYRRLVRLHLRLQSIMRDVARGRDCELRKIERAK